MLFNIYINSCITELERLAHAKAAATGGVPFGLYVPAAAGDAFDMLLSLWFADDSSVVETDIGRLQWLVDTLGDLLRLIGLLMNILKTKLLITMGQMAKHGPSPGVICLKVYGSVETVTEFPHLGTMLNSRELERCVVCIKTEGVLSLP